MVKLYEYTLEKKGLILESDLGFGEISPLPGFSKETFDEAKGENKNENVRSSK